MISLTTETFYLLNIPILPFIILGNKQFVFDEKVNGKREEEEKEERKYLSILICIYSKPWTAFRATWSTVGYRRIIKISYICTGL